MYFWSGMKVTRQTEVTLENICDNETFENIFTFMSRSVIMLVIKHPKFRQLANLILGIVEKKTNHHCGKIISFRHKC